MVKARTTLLPCTFTDAGPSGAEARMVRVGGKPQAGRSGPWMRLVLRLLSQRKHNTRTLPGNKTAPERDAAF